MPSRDEFPGESSPAIEDAVRTILAEVGENRDREGLLETPARVSRAMSFLTSGYGADIEQIMTKALFEEECDEMVLIRDIELYSLCEHHMLPFVGTAHVAYLPRGKVIGLSKLPRLVDVFARRLQVQERLTQQIASAIECYLQPKGVAVVVEAAHYCMMMRGVQKQNSTTITSCMLGEFKNPNGQSRSEFLQLLRLNSPLR
jgi:GTP cyclohydrolase I